MKITLSRSQWENIGKKAGWTKVSALEGNKYPQKCPDCKGNKMYVEKIKNPGTGEYRSATFTCELCKGKGYVNEQDVAERKHAIGVGPCPFGNCTTDHNA